MPLPHHKLLGSEGFTRSGSIDAIARPERPSACSTHCLAPHPALRADLSPQKRGEVRKSHVEKHRLAVTLQPNVEAIDRAAVARLARRDQRAAPIRRHQRQHRIG
jgi:hypothetical protein